MQSSPGDHPKSKIKSWAILIAWTIAALALAVITNSYVARSYSVHGISMEPTLHSGEVVLISKLKVTTARLFGQTYTPPRGAMVVFTNPFYNTGQPDMYIVKRVIGLPGDRVTVSDGRITVFPANDPSRGFNPDIGIDGPQGPTSGSVNRVVPENEIFVAGDNRADKNSLDSRNGMSTVPLREVQGVIILKIWPLIK